MNIIEHLEGYVHSKFAIARGIFTLFKLEAKLAGLSVMPLLLSLAILIALCLSTWLIAIILITYTIMFVVSPLTALSIVLASNCIVLLSVSKYLSVCVKQLSFSKTRALLRGSPLSENRNELVE